MTVSFRNQFAWVFSIYPTPKKPIKSTPKGQFTPYKAKWIKRRTTISRQALLLSTKRNSSFSFYINRLKFSFNAYGGINKNVNHSNSFWLASQNLQENGRKIRAVKRRYFIKNWCRQSGILPPHHTGFFWKINYCNFVSGTTLDYFIKYSMDFWPLAKSTYFPTCRPDNDTEKI